MYSKHPTVLFAFILFTTLLPRTTSAQQLFTSDVVIQGRLNTGFDAPSSPSFGLDTIRLSQNNLRIHFDDTSSSGSFPANDWRLVANDSSDGGSNYFAIQDATGNVVPFKVEAGAPMNALLVADGGDIGIGTEAPTAPLHVKRTGIFDEARIFVENDDNAIAFRELFELRNNGGVQFTFSNSSLNEAWKFTTDTINRFTITRDQTGGPEFAIFQDGRVIMGGGPAINFDLKANGNLNIAGALNEMSDENAKENFADVDPHDVLEKVTEMPITTWNYKHDDESIRHIGPTAQDFRAAFELGDDPKKISSMDRSGVALVSIQALNEQIKTIKKKQSEIDQLNQTVEDLNGRLEKLEQLLIDRAQ